MSRHFLQTLAQLKEKFASSQTPRSPERSPYAALACLNQSQPEFIQIARLVTLLICLFAASSVCGAGQASADLFETRLAEGIKLLGQGRLLESVKVLNSAKQSAPQ